MDLKKIQSLPEFQRKIVFWSVFVLIFILAFGFWFIKAKRKLEAFESKELREKIKLPANEDQDLYKQELEEEIQNLEEFKKMIEQLSQSEQDEQKN